ncbi:hypothetical protein HYT56_01470 [Candidatus Woesearchaeota archaeon]|nr:hypothetical protein [Candidatus Woesearchaeota archaeon]
MIFNIQDYKENLEVFEKRIELLIGSKLKLNNKIINAVAVQDAARSKIKGWDGTKEIRKWRERKAS